MTRPYLLEQEKRKYQLVWRRCLGLSFLLVRHRRPPLISAVVIAFLVIYITALSVSTACRIVSALFISLALYRSLLAGECLTCDVVLQMLVCLVGLASRALLDEIFARDRSDSCTHIF